jgi:GNAT superfamily N-acetyltransferase
MFGQKLNQIVERTSDLVPVPSRIAEGYLAGTWLEGAPIVHEGDKSKVLRIFESPAAVSGVGSAMFRIDAKFWHVPDGKLHQDHICFEYVDVDPSHQRDTKTIAEMHLNQVDADTFWLRHRYVHPEYGRRTGIGTALYHQAEHWLQQVAKARHRDVMIGLTAAQVELIRWLQKEKFLILQGQRDRLNEVFEYPDHFTFDHPSYDPKFAKETWIFPKETSSRQPEHSILLRFQKQIPSGTPSPNVDEIMKNFVPSW